jgi:hypothetical protein
MEVAVLVVIGSLLALLGLSTALSCWVRVVSRVIARGRYMHPQTRYFVG